MPWGPRCITYVKTTEIIPFSAKNFPLKLDNPYYLITLENVAVKTDQTWFGPDGEELPVLSKLTKQMSNDDYYIALGGADPVVVKNRCVISELTFRFLNNKGVPDFLLDNDLNVELTITDALYAI